jgi:transcription-repair coupling factor (superfamily II helicase)
MKKPNYLYTDHQIFERYHKFNIKNSYSKNKYHFKELTTLSVGDYVTHIDHGIGFGGLQKYRSKTQEAIKLVYADNDVYVSIHSLQISKYTGKDGTPPKIYKLGSNAWKVLKQKPRQE